ncbi:MAG: hypothetical protein A4E58_01401 [Syntrophorhabdus sp. PtaB.Bin006]|nr:MAG: hypothetical protein A4E58_01401 [Syntrophorhabdus sp. PtaB.Bin006]
MGLPGSDGACRDGQREPVEHLDLHYWADSHKKREAEASL